MIIGMKHEYIETHLAKHEYIEGPQAAADFERLARKVFQATKDSCFALGRAEKGGAGNAHPRLRFRSAQKPSIPLV